MDAIPVINARARLNSKIIDAFVDRITEEMFKAGLVILEIRIGGLRD